MDTLKRALKRRNKPVAIYTKSTVDGPIYEDPEETDFYEPNDLLESLSETQLALPVCDRRYLKEEESWELTVLAPNIIKQTEKEIARQMGDFVNFVSNQT